MTQLIINGIYLPETSKDKYQCYPGELSVNVQMISGRTVQEAHTRHSTGGRGGQKTQTLWSSGLGECRCDRYMERRSRALPWEVCAPASCRRRREAAYRDADGSRGRSVGTGDRWPRRVRWVKIIWPF